MKTETKVFIVLILLFASLGPISFFFDTSEPQQIDLDEDQDQSLFINLQGNVTGKVMEFEPYISYVGVSSQNSEEYARAVIDSIGYTQNYTLEVMLNPSGNGYLYKILIPLNSTADAPYVGFRLTYRLESFFTGSSNYPIVLGKVMLPETFMIDDQVIVTENQSVISSILYSNRVNSSATIFCLDYSVVRTGGTLASVYEPCTDLTGGGSFYGLSLEDLAFAVEKNVQTEMNVTSILSAVMIYEYPQGQNISAATEAFEGLGFQVMISNVTNRTNFSAVGITAFSPADETVGQIKDEAAKYSYLSLKEE
jgi:hypothetical protein